MSIVCQFGRTGVVLSLLYHIISLETGFQPFTQYQIGVPSNETIPKPLRTYLILHCISMTLLQICLETWWCRMPDLQLSKTMSFLTAFIIASIILKAIWQGRCLQSLICSCPAFTVLCDVQQQTFTIELFWVTKCSSSNMYCFGGFQEPA